jgi:cytochrome c biogenesis protein CcmG/thiol:disulfide interchange protein DsbE
MKRNWLVWMPLLALAFVAGLAIFRLANPNTDYVSSEMVGKPLPEFTLPAATDGVEGLTTANFRDGKPRMLNIFASWCLPCKAEAPYLEQIKEGRWR